MSSKNLSHFSIYLLKNYQLLLIDKFLKILKLNPVSDHLPPNMDLLFGVFWVSPILVFLVSMPVVFFRFFGYVSLNSLGAKAFPFPVNLEFPLG